MDTQETRKLASIRQVLEVSPIEGADSIELAIIDGWQCVVKKGEFKPNDLAVYFEIDSFLPIEPRYEFLRKSSLKKNHDGSEGFRIKTVRLRKQLSQGLLLPLSEFPEIQLQTIHPEESVGLNLTDILGVKKWELPLPACLRGKIKGYFPSFIRKTDQERIQNTPNVLTSFWNTKFEITQKLDGSSLTAYLKDGKFGVCSRTIELEETEENAYWKTARKYQLEKVLRHLNRNLAFQGEMAGLGVQGNPDGLEDLRFFIYDVWSIDEGRYLTLEERRNLSDGSLGIEVPCVPGYCDNIQTIQEFVESHGITNEDISEDVKKKVLEITSKEKLEHEDFEKITQFITRQKRLEALLACADGFSGLNPKVHREGLVFKSVEPIDGCVLSFKVISNKYLEKEK